MKETVSLDFFTVPTATFKVLFAFLVLSNDRRQILHFNVTQHPNAQWTARQLLDACGFDKIPQYLVRDRDAIFGERFREQAKSLAIEEVVTSPRSPWQNPYAERVIGPIRRECIDHVIVLGERHLKCILSEYVDYYNNTRTHRALDKDVPQHRDAQKNVSGKIVSFKRVGGLHQEYFRLAA